MKNKMFPLAIIAALGLAAIACTIPIGVATAQPDPNQVAIQVAQTVAAINAQNAAHQVQPTLAPAPTLAPLPTLTPYPTITPYPVSTTVPCLWATAVDVNYPDHTSVTHSTAFNKTWSFTNVGSCSWNSGYYVKFMSGTAMGGVTTHLANVVPPNGYINITLNLTAPATAGTYRGDYGLYSDNGVYIGQVWVVIDVV